MCEGEHSLIKLSNPCTAKEITTALLLCQKDRVPFKRLRFNVLTRRKTTTKKHVEEVLGWDVGLKPTVEVRVTVSVPSRVEFLISELVILLPLLWVAQYRVCITNGWNIDNKEAVSFFLLQIIHFALQTARTCLSHYSNEVLNYPRLVNLATSAVQH